ncbi:TonB-dependent receptor domain-containing protein [Lysobacter korlensis]|uniref:TonB-dependent receptor domain-containing protein n=1 Tax=Lysobacter korlensis TaxID=553636 RepID=A0ABV6RHD1_9GAMM
MSRQRTSAFLRRSPLMLGIVMALTAPAFAQTAPADEEDAQPAAAQSEAATDLDTVVVTGSRIRRAGFDTLEPATVVTREYIAERGLTNVADALNEIPGFGAGITPEGGQSTFGPGVNFVNRFGLGTNRTLTLVNGRRFVSSNAPSIFGPAAPGLQVDLNVVPSQLVERVENLAVGGAPTYGSDAIAGVVNLILRKDYEGTSFGANYGVTSEFDNHRQNVWALTGQNFADGRGNVTFSLSYDNVNGVLQRERDFYANGYFFATNPLASLVNTAQPGRTPGNDGRFDPTVPFNTGNADGIPNSVLAVQRRIWGTAPGGYIYPIVGGQTINAITPRGFGPQRNVFLGFDANGRLVPYNTGTLFDSVNASGGDGLNLVEQGQITSDLERFTFNTTARFGLTDAIDVFFEGTFYNAESTELADQSAYNAPLFGGASGALRVQATHPLLTPEARATLAANGITQFAFSRASRDLVENAASSTTELGRAVIGLDGDFEFADRIFYWETSANYGRNLTQFFGTSLLQQNFINAINVSVNAAGQIVCNPNANNAIYLTASQNLAVNSRPIADPNCVPLDLFGEGRPSQAARDYVTARTQSESLLEQEVYNFNIASTLVELWSGPLSYALGYERRTESGLFVADPVLAQGLTRSVAIAPNGGEFTTNEVFGEVLIPLVSPDNNWLGLRKLDLTGKYRQVDNEINGEFDTYTYGLQWKPFNDLELRGNFTRSLRAPAITELFTPVSPIFTFVQDPCDSTLVNAGTKPATRAANCAAFYNFYGLNPASFTSNARLASVQGSSGGNPGLLNESADSVTYGFVWAPSFAEGLVVSADYYNIEITDAIVSLNGNEIASGCFDNDDFNAADVPNANSFCSLLTRNAPGTTGPGQITFVTSGYVNGAYLNFEGYSSEIRYGFDTDGLGRFTVSANAYFPKTLVSSNNRIVEDESASEIGVTENYQLNLGWLRAKLGATFSANYTSGGYYDVNFTPESRDILRVDGQWLFNAGVNYKFSDTTRVRFAVTNLLNEEPPFPTIGIGTYDQLGRRFNLAAEWNF